MTVEQYLSQMLGDLMMNHAKLAAKGVPAVPEKPESSHE